MGIKKTGEFKGHTFDRSRRRTEENAGGEEWLASGVLRVEGESK